MAASTALPPLAMVSIPVWVARWSALQTIAWREQYVSTGLNTSYRGRGYGDLHDR
jgi:hypothetical protein